jgi:hypothetical protein
MPKRGDSDDMSSMITQMSLLKLQAQDLSNERNLRIILGENNSGSHHAAARVQQGHIIAPLRHPRHVQVLGPQNGAAVNDWASK